MAEYLDECLDILSLESVDNFMSLCRETYLGHTEIGIKVAVEALPRTSDRVAMGRAGDGQSVTG